MGFLHVLLDEAPMPSAPAAKRSGRKKESAYEAAKRLGLIGCIDGPPDLALNHRKYIRKAVRAKYRPD